MNAETDKLVKHCLEYAKDLLTDTGESYPFGAFLDTIGNVHPLEMEIDTRDIPQNGVVIDKLRNYCKEEMQADKMNGYALAYEVELQEEENSEKIDAIAIELVHKDKNDLPTFYLPFKVGNDRETTFDDVFAVK